MRAHLAAKELGLKLIVGARLDLQDAPSVLCLPRDRQAYGRLSRVLSLGQMRAKKGECTLYLDDVAQHAEGQIFIALAPDEWDWRERASMEADASRTAAIIPFAPRAEREALSPSPLPRIESAHRLRKVLRGSCAVSRRRSKGRRSISPRATRIAAMTGAHCRLECAGEELRHAARRHWRCALPRTAPPPAAGRAVLRARENDDP